MEVHQHTHTARKKWTHYFWEFIMLFLAVFCGFLAENQREHFIEHKRAKIYAANLYKELQKDTVQLNFLIKWTDTLVRRFDTLCSLSIAHPSVSNGKLYFYSGHVGSIRMFSSESSTMDQLKNSGNLRIMKTEIALKISEYQRRLESVQKDYNLFEVEYETMLGLRMKIFDGALSVDLFNRNREAKFRDSVFQLNPPLVNDDPRLMKELIGWVKQESIFWKNNIREHLEPINKTAQELLGLLNEAYHLK